MPIYEFKCAVCAQRFEKLCALGETGAQLACPKCGKPGPVRVMSRFGRVQETGNDTGGLETSGGGCASCQAGSCSTCGH